MPCSRADATAAAALCRSGRRWRHGLARASRSDLLLELHGGSQLFDRLLEPRVVLARHRGGEGGGQRVELAVQGTVATAFGVLKQRDQPEGDDGRDRVE